jgi:hypothetical protein
LVLLFFFFNIKICKKRKFTTKDKTKLTKKSCFSDLGFRGRARGGGGGGGGEG